MDLLVLPVNAFNDVRMLQRSRQAVAVVVVYLALRRLSGTSSIAGAAAWRAF